MITFTPSFSNYRKHVAGAVPALIIILVIDYWRVQQPLPVYVTGCVVLVGLSVTFAVLYFRNTYLVAERHSLTTRNLFGVTREISGDRLAKAVLVSHLATNRNASPLRLIVLDSDGRALVRWTGLTWTLDQMNSLVETLGIPLDTMDQPITPGELKERYPRAVRSFEAYPVRWGLGMSVVVIVVIAAVCFAVVSLS